MGRHDRNTELGDQAAICTACGWARRFVPAVAEAPASCPECAAPVLSACPSCKAPVLSVMAVECGLCGEKLRAETLLGLQIRRPPRGERQT